MTASIGPAGHGGLALVAAVYARMTKEVKT